MAGMEPERVPYAMTEAGMVYAERYVDADGRAWVAPCGTRVEDPDQWRPDVLYGPPVTARQQPPI